VFSFCYAQWPNYLQCIIFPSLSILQHYIKFDVCTIIMLEKLLWSRSFGTIVSHLVHPSYFFLRVKPSLSGPTCCTYLFKMLGFDCSCINISFLAKWSPYSSSCDGTCKDQCLSFPCYTMGYSCNVTCSCPITCLAFQKSSVAILSSNIVFFDGPTTQAIIYFVSSKCPFECCANTFPLLCKSCNKGLVISSF
jgi:hypothetical protein